MFHAHPNYRSEGPWYDYASVAYEEDEDKDQKTRFPCKFACFFVEPQSGEHMALVQEVKYQTEIQKKRESQVFDHWTLRNEENKTTKNHDAILESILVGALSDRLYVLDPNPVGGFTRPHRSGFDVLVVKYS